jgi:hypothetical protein
MLSFGICDELDKIRLVVLLSTANQVFLVNIIIHLL